MRKCHIGAVLVPILIYGLTNGAFGGPESEKPQPISPEDQRVEDALGSSLVKAVSENLGAFFLISRSYSGRRYGGIQEVTTFTTDLENYRHLNPILKPCFVKYDVSNEMFTSYGMRSNSEPPKFDPTNVMIGGYQSNAVNVWYVWKGSNASRQPTFHVITYDPTTTNASREVVEKFCDQKRRDFLVIYRGPFRGNIHRDPKSWSLRFLYVAGATQ